MVSFAPALELAAEELKRLQPTHTLVVAARPKTKVLRSAPLIAGPGEVESELERYIRKGRARVKLVETVRPLLSRLVRWRWTVFRRMVSLSKRGRMLVFKNDRLLAKSQRSRGGRCASLSLSPLQQQLTPAQDRREGPRTRLGATRVPPFDPLPPLHVLTVSFTVSDPTGKRCSKSTSRPS